MSNIEQGTSNVEVEGRRNSIFRLKLMFFLFFSQLIIKKERSNN